MKRFEGKQGKIIMITNEIERKRSQLNDVMVKNKENRFLVNDTHRLNHQMQ